MYAIFTGTAPVVVTSYRDPNDALKQAIEPASAMNPGITSQLNDLFMAALSPDSARRPRSAREIWQPMSRLPRLVRG